MALRVVYFVWIIRSNLVSLVRKGPHFLFHFCKRNACASPHFRLRPSIFSHGSIENISWSFQGLLQKLLTLSDFKPLNILFRKCLRKVRPAAVVHNRRHRSHRLRFIRAQYLFDNIQTVLVGVSKLIVIGGSQFLSASSGSQPSVWLHPQAVARSAGRSSLAHGCGCENQHFKHRCCYCSSMVHLRCCCL